MSAPFDAAALDADTEIGRVFAVLDDAEANWFATLGEAALIVGTDTDEWTADLGELLAGHNVTFVLPEGLDPSINAAALVRAFDRFAEPHVASLHICDGFFSTPDQAETLARPVADWLKPRRAPSRFTHAGSLLKMDFPPLKWVIPGHLPEGCAIFAGAPKIGKSWLMLDWALAVDAGGFAFSSVKCERGDVLYLALEDNLRRLQRRLKALVRPGDPEPGISFATEAPRWGAGLEELIREWAADVERGRLVIIDVLARVRPLTKGGEAGYSDDYAAIAGAQALAGELGLAIVFVHHTRKLPGDDPFDAVSGTLGLSGAADAVAVLRRDGHGVTLYTRGRDIEEAEHAVSFDRLSCRWGIQGAAADVRKSDERRAVLDAMEEAGEPMTPTQICDATGMPSGNVRPLLFKMVKSGDIEKAGRGKYALPGKAGNIGNTATFGGGGDHE